MVIAARLRSGVTGSPGSSEGGAELIRPQGHALGHAEQGQITPIVSWALVVSCQNCPVVAGDLLALAEPKEC